MLPERSTSIPSPVMAIIVIAITSIAATVVAAWVVRGVARSAIEKTSPEHVASVVLALGALLNGLRLFLPWSKEWDRGNSTIPGHSALPETSLHTAVSTEPPQEEQP
jgi:hypothetical protein